MRNRFFAFLMRYTHKACLFSPLCKGRIDSALLSGRNSHYESQICLFDKSTPEIICEAGLRLNVPSKNHNTGGGFIQPVHKPKFFPWLSAQLLAQNIGKLSSAGAVSGYRNSAWFIDNDYIVILVYDWNTRYCYPPFR